MVYHRTIMFIDGSCILVASLKQSKSECMTSLFKSSTWQRSPTPIADKPQFCDYFPSHSSVLVYTIALRLGETGCGDESFSGDNCFSPARLTNVGWPSTSSMACRRRRYVLDCLLLRSLDPRRRRRWWHTLTLSERWRMCSGVS